MQSLQWHLHVSISFLFRLQPFRRFSLRFFCATVQISIGIYCFCLRNGWKKVPPRWFCLFSFAAYFFVCFSCCSLSIFFFTFFFFQFLSFCRRVHEKPCEYWPLIGCFDSSLQKTRKKSKSTLDSTNNKKKPNKNKFTKSTTWSVNFRFVFFFAAFFRH